jgi:hypothetical protein
MNNNGQSGIDQGTKEAYPEFVLTT